KLILLSFNGGAQWYLRSHMEDTPLRLVGESGKKYGVPVEASCALATTVVERGSLSQRYPRKCIIKPTRALVGLTITLSIPVGLWCGEERMTHLPNWMIPA
ncbi:MAG: hypothetical protein D6747_02270, partial [Chlorobiota bacterium]